jgi:cytochrome c oxidase assembly protein subunit 15
MTQENKTLASWLLLCCFFIFAIIIVGAVTRLTESGLSMVEWRIAMDMLPPIGDAAWQSEFALYQNSPQYMLVNQGMSLDEFKNIYFWEWLHRLLGRLIGLIYALPLFFFWARSKIPNELKRRLVFFLFLGGLQGFFGWFMVRSGLIAEPRVSHFRLALHLGTALLLLSLLWVTGMQLLGKMRPPLFRRHGKIALIVTCFAIFYGALVAGLDAGLIYNTFPLMGGNWIPSEFLFEAPWWKNFLYNHATVQWTHRVLGLATFIVVFSLGLRCYHGGARIKGSALCGFVTVQLILGIATLLSVVTLPLAVLHQAFAALTLLAVVTVIAEQR